MSIKINDLSFAYANNKILENITLEISQGEMIGIMGLSGCGKTTLLRILLGLNQIMSGKASLDGISYNEQNLPHIRTKISYIPQNGALYPHLKTKKNILLPIKVQRKVTSEDEKRVLELAEICNINPDLFNHYPSELSGGQRQRIAILRALLMDTPHIFLDEPLSALDPITKISIQKEFKNIFKDKNKTIIMVTHSLSEVKFLCDKLAIIQNGRVEQFDQTMNVINSPANPFIENFIQAQL